MTYFIGKDLTNNTLSVENNAPAALDNEAEKKIGMADSVMKGLNQAEQSIEQRLHTTLALQASVKLALATATTTAIAPVNTTTSTNTVNSVSSVNNVSANTTSKGSSKIWNTIINNLLAYDEGELCLYQKATSGTALEKAVILGRENQDHDSSFIYKNRADSLSFLQNNFNAYFKDEARKISQELELPPEQQTQYMAQANAMVTNIIQNYLTDTTLNTPSQATMSSMTLKAHEEAQYALITLHNNWVKQNTVPEIYARKDGKYTVIEKAPDITNLVLKGGGMKGVGYIGVLTAMERLGLMSPIKHIAGTSAGAINSSCIATGMDATELKALNDSLNMSEQMGKGVEPNGKNITLGWNINPFAKSATKLLETLQNVFRTNVTSHITADAIKQSQLNDQDKRQLLTMLNTETHPITFRDLRLLSQIDSTRFKDLTLVGYDSDNKKNVYFNADTTPDLPIATATRISMSIPVLFKPVELGNTTMVDGGVGSNLPTEVFNPYASRPSFAKNAPYVNISRDMAFATTMAFSFDEDGEAEKLQFRPQDADGLSFFEKLLYRVTVGKNGLEAYTKDQNKFNETGPNGFVVYHGDLDTTDFSASRQRIDHAQTEAQIRFLEQIRRNGQGDADNAIEREYNSITAVVKDMSNEMLLAITKQDRSTLEARSDKTALALYVAASNPNIS